ncbi:AAA family ATPase [Coleofasciculus sp. FACHB-64]|jgi:SpoVK/Ycf46/Vps4 family AAA+-type ATPase|uniref:stress-responsive protein Ycf46 n=1 Tax=Cyanophyceae TaxID=3028117 RepID=UPI0016856492|nr:MULTISPECIES: AAA family ATPase [unclassified Coleofasciculus]MBD1841640.1 AAA family ATPase [Coleofasciculus sp. FACHB-501]MBD1878772.1 AAA family ATPase [Coleofasciculus sp. FACHB-T130]MBD1892864.1 AAA family ATPase [Coleofasciculus sp. FACHB-SPT9]MBD1894462.1 AAA family ATPase [Coleofasciculus sp. FACHB-129]MBD1903091.1 AAA family ATPase [Coleofasciculus sp. FACHB-125]
MKEELDILVQAQYPLIYLVTSEEERAERTIANIAQTKSLARRVYIWTVTHGIVEYGQPRHITQHNTVSPEAAIEWVVRQREPGIFIFKDLHPFIDSPATTRWLRDAIASFKGTQKIIILMSPVQQIPIELEKEVVVLDYPLPDLAELNQVLSSQLEQTRSRRTTTEVREKLLKATLGLTRDEAEKVYRKAFVKTGRLTETEVDIILSEKKQLIRRNGILEFIEEDETIDSVGGLEELKRWLRQRSNAFTEKAREYGLPQPKGMLILGVPGCGKSLIAKTTARLWSLPLLRLDMGRVYDGSMVGRSEANLRNALKTAESISPAILFIDELDKAFAGTSGSADSDGGTSSRIFGSFLTWLQEKTSPVFVMATANRVERLPGEFLRKGRFDEIFFVDLPTAEERKEIFNIHLSKRKRDISRFDLDQLAKVSDGFSGAEIEQGLVAAMYEAFAQDREFTQLDIIAAIKATLPLSRTMNEQVTALRDWARQRARPAASSVAEYQRLEF